jgi:hypothetical protein
MPIESFPDEIKFNSQKNLSEEDQWEICSQLCTLHNKAIQLDDPLSWEEFGINAMYVKLLLPQEDIPILNHQTYKNIDKVANFHYENNRLNRHLKISAAEKILFPSIWNLRKKDFHSDEIVWKKLENNLLDINPAQNWQNLSMFFESAKNMKIVAPRRFDSLNLQTILGKSIWNEEINKFLNNAKKEDYRNFTSLASNFHILQFPGKIELDKEELNAINIEAERLKDDDILTFAEFSAKRNLLSAKEIKITDSNVDLIF